MGIRSRASEICCYKVGLVVVYSRSIVIVGSVVYCSTSSSIAVVAVIVVVAVAVVAVVAVVGVVVVVVG